VSLLHLNVQGTRDDVLVAGYVALGSALYDGGRLAAISERAERELTDAGVRLVATAPVTAGHEQRAIRELGREPWDFLVANVVNWIDYRAATRLLLAFRDRPLVLYSSGGWTEDGTLVSPAAGAGSTALRYPLERWGVRFSYLFNAPDSPMDVDGILRFGRAARAARLLASARIGVVGWNDMGLYTTAVDVARLRGRIGPEVEAVDLLELQRAMEAVDRARLAEAIERETAGWEWPHGRPPQGVLERTFSLYLGTVDLCRRRGFDAVSWKTVEGVSGVLGVLHSAASSLVATAGYPYVDENDVGNLVAELALRFLGAPSVTFLEHYEHHPQWILLGVDGFVPHQLVDGPVVMKRTDLLSEGLAHGSRMRSGRMTLACLAEAGDGYRMHVVSGEARPAPRWIEMGTELPSWPSVSFHPDASVRRVLDHVLSQHFAAAYGDWVEELKHLCALLGVDAVVDC
jgi:L-fucose isomerase-like protein